MAWQPDFPDDFVPACKYALVISCVDFRLMDDVTHFLEHENMLNRYYQISFAGASLGLCDHPDLSRIAVRRDQPMFEAWRRVLEDHIRVVLMLTDKKLWDIYIIEHRDCGAYREWLGHDFDYSAAEQEAERQVHLKYALTLEAWLKNLFQELIQEGVASKVPRILSFLMDVRGKVEHLDQARNRGARKASGRRGPKSK